MTTQRYATGKLWPLNCNPTGGTMDKADIPFLSATELSRLIQAKEVSPLEATEASLDRIDNLDFKFNA